MWKIVSAVGFAGWAGIVWLAWRLADARIATCGIPYEQSTSNCIVRAQAARDFVLVAGLTVALVGVLVVLAIALLERAQPSGKLSGWRPTSRADRPLLRS